MRGYLCQECGMIHVRDLNHLLAGTYMLPYSPHTVLLWCPFFFFFFLFLMGWVYIFIDTMPLCQCPSNAKRDMISNFTTSMRTRSLQMLIVGFGGFISMQLGLKRWRKAGTKPSLGLPPIKNVFSDNVCINNNKNTSLGLLFSKTSSMFTFLCVQRFSPHTSRTALPSPFKPYDHVVKIITRKKIYKR